MEPENKNVPPVHNVEAQLHVDSAVVSVTESDPDHGKLLAELTANNAKACSNWY
tara:strand:+ start:333 stop:494 length:162 start_codon:yes stop_codon:yes gene_type:complete